VGRREQLRKTDIAGSRFSFDVLAGNRNAILLLFVLVVGTYLNTLWNQFTYDDRPYVKENKYITSLRYLPDIFTKAYPPDDPDLSLYRPLVELSYLTDYAVGVHQTELSLLTAQPEVSPIPFHITNILIHFAVCIALYFLVLRFTRERIVPLVSAAIFAVHPVHVEVVASVAGRAESLCALFYLLSIHFFVSWRESVAKRESGERYLSPPLLLSIAWFFAALLSKETAITLPVILFLVDMLVLKTYGEERSCVKRLGRLFATYLPYIAVFVFYAAVRVLVIGEVGIKEKMTYFYEKNPSTVMPSMLIAFVMYLKLLVIPTILHADYNFPILFVDHYFIQEPQRLLSAWALIGLVLLVGYLSISFILAFSKQRIAFLLFWLPVTLFPVSNIIPFGDFMAERFLYLPSAAYCVLIGALFAYALARIGGESARRRRTLWIVVAVFIALLGLRSAVRNTDWRNGIQFWKAVLRTAPENRDVYYALGHVYADSSKEHLMLGNLARERADFSAAAEHLEQAAKDEERAIHYYQVSIEKHPDYYQAYYNLGILLSEAQKPDHLAARRLFERGLKYYPQNLQHIDTFYFAIGLSYGKTGEYERAAEYVQRALRLQPRNVKYLNSLGSALANLRQYDRAEALWKKALEIEPDNPETHENLEKLYALRRRSRL
jgi:tetratricopeptide (TPR) repeat protein